MVMGVDESFYQRLERVDGWMARPAADFTAHLLHVGLHGNVLEFGVFHGRYLCLLYKLTSKTGNKVLGIDSFMGSPDINASKQYITHNIQETCGDASRLTLHCADTMSLTSPQVLELLPAPIRFISVDAGHEADNLENDLNLAAELLSTGGIVAVDDAFNFSTPGAIEGTCRFFENDNRGRLAPFAHCYNKLFLTTPDCHADFLELSREFAVSNQELDYCSRTVARMKENAQGGFVPQFYGYEIIPFL